MDRYTELKTKLLQANDSYYNKNTSIISDEEYDKLKEEFVTSYPDDPFIKTIGAKVPVNSKWEKYEHLHPMYSCNKATNESEFDKWINDNDLKNRSYGELIVSEKLDGIAISMIYFDGKLVTAATRGSGTVGENITSNVLKMQNVKPVLPNNFSGELRGEIILRADDFEKVNFILEQRKQKKLANPRNGASGIAKRLDGQFSEYLTVLYYHAFTTEENEVFVNKSDEYSYIDIILNLQTCPHYVGNHEFVKMVYNEYEYNRRITLDYDIDGLVVETNDLVYQDKLGLLGGNLRGRVAWKFAAMKAETTLLNIEWTIGKSGRYTPVAILEPVRIGGVTVSKASLHNVENFTKLQLTKGDRVLISRRNDVIPYLEQVISKGNLGEFTVPTHCDICKSPLNNDGVFLTCVNESCDGNKLGNLKKWIKTLGLKGIADATIEQLYESNLIDTPDDFYRLSEDSFLGLEGFGKRKIEKFLETIYGKMEISFGELIGGLNIPGISTKTAELLYSNGYKDANVIAESKKEDLIKIIGIGDLSAEAIIDGFNDKMVQINSLFEVGIKIKEEEPVVEGGILSGKKVVFTGEISITREEAQALVKKNGGTCPSGISKEVDFLVCADPSQNTTKLQKAQKYGITIISGEEFYKMVNYDPSQVVEVEEIMKPVIKTPKHIEQYKNFLEFD